MSNSILEDFFNVKPKMADPVEPSVEFRPTSKKGQNGVYKAVVRFLPNPEDPNNKSVVSKNTVFLTNPLTQAKMEIDCPSTVGQPDPLQTTFFALRNSANPILQENSKQFSRKQRYASLIQVLSCESEPALVNKILVWRYGFKIHEKIQNEMNPPMGEPKNPFNMLTGRPFSVVVKEVSGYQNYDASGFFDLGLPDSAMRMIVPNAQGQPQVYAVTPETVANAQGKQMVFDYLKNNAPSLEPYEYHPWTDEINTFVNTCIQIYSNPNQTVNAVAASQNPMGAAGMQMPGMQMPTTGAPTGNAMFPPTGMPTMGSTPAAQPAAPQIPQMPQMPQMPTMPQMPSMNEAAPVAPAEQPAAPQMPQMPQMPTMGLDGAAVAQVSPQGFGATPGLSPDVDALLNQGTPSVQPSAPSMGLDLADVLNGAMA